MVSFKVSRCPLPAGTFFTHAGVRPGIPLGTQREQDLLEIRKDFLLHEEDFGKYIIHGHTPAKEPDFRPNCINKASIPAPMPRDG